LPRSETKNLQKYTAISAAPKVLAFAVQTALHASLCCNTKFITQSLQHNQITVVDNLTKDESLTVKPMGLGNRIHNQTRIFHLIEYNRHMSCF
jgi:hypothetical protein